MTKLEVINWVETFSKNKQSLRSDELKQSLRSDELKKIIVCPPFTLLQMFNEYIKEHNLPIEIGAQNISRFPQGPYTGEINGAQIKDFADYVLVGHSERRGFGEDESVVEEKLKMSIDYNLTPILCIQGNENKIPQEVSIVAYEPTFAIGTGIPDTPENAEKVAKKVKEKTKLEFILYGGSVSPGNVASFTNMENLNGVLVGTDSLDAEKFLRIIENA